MHDLSTACAALLACAYIIDFALLGMWWVAEWEGR